MPETTSAILEEYLSSDDLSLLYESRNQLNGLSAALGYLPLSPSELQLVASALRSCHAGIQINLDLALS